MTHQDEDMLGELDVNPRGTFGRQAKVLSQRISLLQKRVELKAPCFGSPLSRQASEPAKPSSWNRQVSATLTAAIASPRILRCLPRRL